MNRLEKEIRRIVSYMLRSNESNSSSYLSYVALLTQTGTSAPVATVLENTLGGTVVWTRQALGEYWGTLAGAFPELKTYIPGFDNGRLVMMPISENNIADAYYNISWLDENTIVLNFYDSSYSPIEWSSTAIGVLNLPEIRVYP